MRYERGWRTVPPRDRVWALVFTGKSFGNCPYYVSQWEPKLRVWVIEVNRCLVELPPEYVYWHPLPKPPKQYAVHRKTYALEKP